MTIDELLGVDELAVKEKYAAIQTAWEENRAADRHRENVALMRESLKLFPNDALLLVQLSSSLERLDGTEAEKAAWLRESIAVQEQILRYGEDSEVRNATQYNICFAYLKNGERQKAIEQANKLGNLYKARENALVCLMEGEEKHQLSREALTPLRWILTTHLTSLAEEDPVWLDRLKKILSLLPER